MKFTHITVKPEQMGGVPSIRGLRILVATVVGMVANRMANDEILAAFPDFEFFDRRFLCCCHYTCHCLLVRPQNLQYSACGDLAVLNGVDDFTAAVDTITAGEKPRHGSRAGLRINDDVLALDF